MRVNTNKIYLVPKAGRKDEPLTFYKAERKNDSGKTKEHEPTAVKKRTRKPC